MFNLQDVQTKERLDKAKEGIDFILKLFEVAGQRQFPRKMTTHYSEGKMFTVNSKEEIIQSCVQSNFLDCRINAYPIHPDDDIDAGLVAPTIIFCDLDISLSYNDEVELLLQNTLNKIKHTFDLSVDSSPSAVIWTGGGYHIYLIMKTKPMLIYPELSKLCNPESEVSKEFLRFCEKYFTDNKSDPNHNITFKSSLLRIPGTLNYKRLNYEPDTAEVRVIYEPIGEVGLTMKRGDRLFRSFTYWCMDFRRVQILKDNERKKVIRQQQQRIQRYPGLKKIDPPKKYWWVERLLERQIDRNRYFCTWKILAPYLVTIKQLSEEEAYDIIKEWLEWCSEVKPFENMDTKIKSGLEKAYEFNPISLNTLRRLNVNAKGEYRNILNAIEK